jgi:hypothetical protein
MFLAPDQAGPAGDGSPPGQRQHLPGPAQRAGRPAPNVTNITVNKQCVLDSSDHLEIAADPVAMADMLNALDPAHPVRVPCLVVLPVTGPIGPVPSF